MPEPYIELMAGTTDRYVRLVDGDAATTDPQQDFTGLVPLTLSSDPELLAVSASADPSVVLAGTTCLGAGGAPIGPLPSAYAAHYTQPPAGWVGSRPLVGVRSYACATGSPSTIVAEDARALIIPGEALRFASGADQPINFRRLKLSINASPTSKVRVTAKLDGAVVSAIDVDIAADCVSSVDWTTLDVLCASRLDPYYGVLRMRYLNLDFGAPFDSIEVGATVGAVRLEGVYPSRFFLDGEVVGGTIGGDTGESAVAEPPTETLAGYEMSCSDAADPPPEGPCGGKEINLTISRFLADIDGDGEVEQVLDLVPDGVATDLALLTLTVTWVPEGAPAGPVPLSGVDEDADGPDDDDPAEWCSVDPPGGDGDQWCLGTSTSASAGLGEIQVTETYYGTGDPRLTRGTGV